MAQGPKPDDDLDAKIERAVAAHLASPEFQDRLKALLPPLAGKSTGAGNLDDQGVKTLIEAAGHPDVISAFRKTFAEYDELRPDALRKYRPGTKA